MDHGEQMSERSFRAVVATVLVAALVLAVIVVFAGLQPVSPSSVTGRTPTAQPTPFLPPTPDLTPTPKPVFGKMDVTAVGLMHRDGASGTSLVLHFVESSIDAIPAAAGSFTVTLSDSGGAGRTLAFTGTPSVDAPGWMGARAEIVARNVLRISIAMSDPTLLEQFTVSGLGISAASDAALGPTSATLGEFAGSLAGGVADLALPSPGTIVARP